MNQVITTAPTAAQRLASVNGGLTELGIAKATAQNKVTALRAELEALKAERSELERQKDLLGVNVDTAMAINAERRKATYTALEAASIDEANLGARIAAVNVELPNLEAAARQEALAAAVNGGTEVARQYRAAAEAFLAAAFQFQASRSAITVLEDSLCWAGHEPKAKLRAYPIAGADLDRALAVAREDAAAGRKVAADLFGSWMI